MDWEPRFEPSWLCLKQKTRQKVVVVRIHPRAMLGNGLARMYEAWLGDRKLYDPADEFKVGQVVRLD